MGVLDGHPGSDASYADSPCRTLDADGTPVTFGPRYRCGYLTVPENRDRPTGKKIKIGVAVLKSAVARPKADPIVVVHGGPGNSGYIVGPSAELWNSDRDVVLVAQRGTFGSQPELSCPEVDKSAVATLLRPVAERQGIYSKAAKACSDRLVKQGWDLTSFDTAESAADLADLRVAMGYPQWNVYAISYGTYLAQQLIHDYPAGIRSVMYDGTVPVGVTNFAWQGTASTIGAIAAGCAEQPACSKAFGDVEAAFTTMVNRLDAKPATVSVDGYPIQIDGFTAVDGLTAASFASAKAADVPKAIHQAANGDYELLGRVLYGSYPGHSFSPSTTSTGLSFSAGCADLLTGYSPAAAAPIASQAFPGIASAVRSKIPNFDAIIEACPGWGTVVSPQRLTSPVYSGIPALFVSGALDGQTSPGWAADLAKGYPNSTVVTFPGLGHGVAIFQDPSCFGKVATSFLNDPQHVDPGCTTALRNPTFTT